MWAFLRFSGQSPDARKPQGDASSPVLLTWKTSPSVDDWVSSGHGWISIQGIGSNGGSGGNSAITAATVLRGASERLEVMSWGLAAKYRVVLNGMLAHVEV